MESAQILNGFQSSLVHQFLEFPRDCIAKMRIVREVFSENFLDAEYLRNIIIDGSYGGSFLLKHA